MISLEQLKWPDSGLLPVVTQDAQSGKVLMLAWVNREALAQTISTKQATYFSRSRNAIWQKGQTSGNSQHLVDLRFDCDLDTVLYIVEPAGPACHTGRVSCFFNELQSDHLVAIDNPWPRADIVTRLAAVLTARRQTSAEKSYVKSLLDRPDKAAAKVNEEAAELIASVANESNERVANEAADLLFHALVLAATRGVDWHQIAAVLESRFGVSGHTEKAQRGVGKN